MAQSTNNSPELRFARLLANTRSGLRGPLPDGPEVVETYVLASQILRENSEFGLAVRAADESLYRLGASDIIPMSQKLAAERKAIWHVLFLAANIASAGALDDPQLATNVSLLLRNAATGYTNHRSSLARELVTSWNTCFDKIAERSSESALAFAMSVIHEGNDDCVINSAARLKVYALGAAVPR